MLCHRDMNPERIPFVVFPVNSNTVIHIESDNLQLLITTHNAQYCEKGESLPTVSLRVVLWMPFAIVWRWCGGWMDGCWSDVVHRDTFHCYK